MTKKEFQNKYSPKYDEITINGVTISYDCYEIKVKDGKDVVCFYNEGGYCFMCSIPLEDADLINRQQAEIKWKTNMLHDLQVSMEEIKPQIKAEAIKEYMKILEEKLSQNTDISNVGYQSIVFDMEQGYKEMVGEGK